MAVRIIKNQWSNWKDLLYLNDLNGYIYINEKMWNGKDNFVCYKGNGSDLTEIRVRLSQLVQSVFENGKTRQVRYNPTKDTVLDAIEYIAYQNHKNPFLELIKKTHWDGVNRVSSFLYDVGFRADPLEDNRAEV
jgi:predicted P-loop ATPase